MELNVYNGEVFERNKIWYAIFATIFILIFTLSIFSKNIAGIILMFFLLGAYIYYGIINIREITLKITNDGLMLNNKIIPRTSYIGFCLEIETNKQIVKNIVFVTKKGHNIYTINDDTENIALFLDGLEPYLPMLEEFHQNFWERFSRKIKL